MNKNKINLVKKPIVSVIIPTYNGSLFIDETLTSVLAQSMPDLEIIVVDDASTDNTLKIIQERASLDERIRCFVQKKGGVSCARNKGIKEARGEYIAFIDHDDLWTVQKLEKQLEVFKKDSRLGLVFSREMIITMDGKPIEISSGFARLQRGYIFKDLFCEHFISPSTVLIKREVFQTLEEWFVESMEMAEEVDLFLRISYSWKIDYCDEILAKWRAHPNNDSKLRKWLLIEDYNNIIGRLKTKIPDFEKNFKREIFKKQRWLSMIEIEILISENKKNKAIKFFLSFLKKFGFYPRALIKFFLLLVFGHSNFEKIRTSASHFVWKR